MSAKKVLILIMGMIIISQTAAMPYSELRSASVISQGTKSIVVGALLDDFRYAAPVNVWNGTTGTFSIDSPATPTSICTASYTTVAPYGGSGYSLKLDYNVSKVNSYAGYVSNLGVSNISTYKTISFWVKGSASGLFFKIEMKNNGADNNKNHGAIYIKDYLDAGVTTAWQQVTIPLHNFANISDWTTAKEFVITFENAQSVINGSPTSGTIYIDDITFSTTAAPITRFDHFGDNVQLCGLGGMIFFEQDAADGGYITSWAFSSVSTSEYHNAANGLKISYTVPNGGNYTYVSFAVGGGNDGWQKIQHNFSQYTNLSFWVRASSATTNPQGIKVELHDFLGTGTGEPFYVIAYNGANQITTTWKKFTIPLTAFMDWASVPLDKTRIAELVFTFENGNAAYKTGTIFIDEIQFE